VRSKKGGRDLTVVPGGEFGLCNAGGRKGGKESFRRRRRGNLVGKKKRKATDTVVALEGKKKKKNKKKCKKKKGKKGRKRSLWWKSRSDLRGERGPLTLWDLFSSSQGGKPCTCAWEKKQGTKKASSRCRDVVSRGGKKRRQQRPPCWGGKATLKKGEKKKGTSAGSEGKKGATPSTLRERERCLRCHFCRRGERATVLEGGGKGSVIPLVS